MRVSDVTPVNHIDGLDNIVGAIVGAVANVASAGLQVYSAQKQLKAQESAAKKARAHELALQAAELKALAEARITQQAVTPAPSVISPVSVPQVVTNSSGQPVYIAQDQYGQQVQVPVSSPASQNNNTMLFVVAGGIALLGLGAIVLLRD